MSDFFASFIPTFNSKIKDSKEDVSKRIEGLDSAIQDAGGLIPEVEAASSALKVSINSAARVTDSAIAELRDSMAKAHADEIKIAVEQARAEEKTKVTALESKLSDKVAALTIANQETERAYSQVASYKKAYEEAHAAAASYHTKLRSVELELVNQKSAHARETAALNARIDSIISTLAAQGAICGNIVKANPSEVGTVVSMALADDTFTSEESRSLYAGSKIFADLKEASLGDFLECVPNTEIGKSAIKKVKLVSASVQDSHLTTRLKAAKVRIADVKKPEAASE